MIRPSLVLVVASSIAGCPSLPRAPGDAGPPETGWWDGTGDLGEDAGERRGDVVRDVRDAKEGMPPGEGLRDPGCVPQCWSRVCGSDGCGGVCGVCPPGTSCSYDRSMCVSQFVQKALGGPCGPTDACQSRIEYPGGSYPNPKWPGCLHDQCLEGPCLAGFCSRTCRMMQDVRVNGTDLLAPDGIEDVDSPVSDCEGGRDDLFSGGFSCVLVEPGSTEGLCLPTASFRPCEATRDCPDGEACGFLVVLGNLERRCLAAPAGAAGIGEACGYDAVTGQTRRCQAWACTTDGCTQACVSDRDCATPGAACDVSTGLCVGAGARCEDDRDCSAWICRPDVVLGDAWGGPVSGGVIQACGPRECRKDPECGDPGYYCRHEADQVGPGQVIAKGRCARREPGGETLGEPCDDDPGDGRPDVVCQDRSYCLDGRCGAMCVSDEDCVVSTMACGSREFEAGGDGTGDVPVPVPVCQWVGGSAKPCQVREDCLEGVCAPWVPAGTGVVELRCLEPPAGSLGPGNPCGEAAWNQTCDTRLCLGGTALVPGICSTVCRDEGDCPGETPFGNGAVKFVCGAVRFQQSGTVYLADDAYVSWCVPVPGESSLSACEPVGWCSEAGETCRAVVRSGVPGGEDRVQYRCVKAAVGGDAGAPCDPDRGGEGCRSGVCAPTAIRGVGFCTTPCDSDALCQALAGGSARCVDRVVIPRDPPGEAIGVRECRVADACVTCRDDRDCPDAALRCADVATLPYEDDLRCAPACESDGDCAAWGPGMTCLEADAPLETSRTGKVRVCVPLVCP